MSDTTRELIQLRDERLKQAIVHLAQQRKVRISVLLRQMWSARWRSRRHTRQP